MRIYHADGTAESQDETFTKGLTGKRQAQQPYGLRGFMLPYSSVAVVRPGNTAADGAVVSVDIAANSKRASTTAKCSEHLHPNVRILRVNIRGSIRRCRALGDPHTTERPIILASMLTSTCLKAPATSACLV